MTILDTNVVSELMKRNPAPTVAAWISSQKRDDIFTTVITVSETLYGIEILPKGKRREALFRAAEGTFAEDFAGQILSFDEPAARAFALISSARRFQGRPIGIHDSQIAAIARANDALVATRDMEDFEDCGVRLINPWDGPANLANSW
jgi:hypothetical protein